MYSQNSNSEDVVNFIKRRKSNLKKVFHSKCCLCGFYEVQEALDFHHVNPQEKSFGISGSLNQTKSLAAQLQELKKCILVCANCHRGIHAGIYMVPASWQNLYDENIANELLNDLEEIKTHKKKYCQRCGAEITAQATYCKSCAALIQRQCDRPSREELKQKIRIMPFTQIATHYKVSDNAIRKWCDSYNLPRKKSEIKQYSDQEWQKI